jgi:starch phosphorylase
VAEEYLALVEDGVEPLVPRVHVFAGKAAPGYAAAKRVIRLIHALADVINDDPRARDRLSVVFVPDYRVSVAEVLIPAGELSEQISTAGTEASGTGNMKFALNGALTIGTLDGANIEMRDAVGDENMFVFGLTAEQVFELQARGYRPAEYLARDASLARLFDALDGDRFSPGLPGLFSWVRRDVVEAGDRYMLVADFASYRHAQLRAARAYDDAAGWAQKAILNVARIGRFSSDRTVLEYARDVWGIRTP